MKRVTYLRAAAGLPVVVPFASLPFVHTGIEVAGMNLFAILAASRLWASSYVPAAAVALYLLRHRPPRAYWCVALLAPLMFLGILMVPPTLFATLSGAYPGGLIPTLLLSGLYILPIGYFYVLLAWLGYRTIDAIGQLDEERPNNRIHTTRGRDARV